MRDYTTWTAITDYNSDGEPIYQGAIANHNMRIVIEIHDEDKAYIAIKRLNKWLRFGRFIGYCWAWWQGFKMQISEWQDR